MSNKDSFKAHLREFLAHKIIATKRRSETKELHYFITTPQPILLEVMEEIGNEDQQEEDG